MAALVVPLAAWGQPATQGAARPVAQPGAQPAGAVASAAVRAATEVRVIEDDRVRIEETRVRGQLQRITVAPKNAAGAALPAYQINVGSAGRDPSQDRSAAGQRVWSVLRF